MKKKERGTGYDGDYQSKTSTTALADVFQRCRVSVTHWKASKGMFGPLGCEFESLLGKTEGRRDERRGS